MAVVRMYFCHQLAEKNDRNLKTEQVFEFLSVSLAYRFLKVEWAYNFHLIARISLYLKAKQIRHVLKLAWSFNFLEVRLVSYYQKLALA